MAIIVTPIPTTPVETFLRDVMPYAPNAPEFEVEYRLKQTLRDFCRRTNAWRQRNTALLTTVAAQEDYAADLPTGTDLASVQTAWYGEIELEVIQAGEEDAIKSGNVAGLTPSIMKGPGNTIRLSPAPAASGQAYVGTITLAPNEASTTVPEFIYFEWRDAIREGTLERLLMQVGKTWSNPNQAMLHGENYRDHCRHASNTYGPVRRVSLRVEPV